MDFTDDEAQVLALLERARETGEATDAAALERAGARYWIFKGDYGAATETLAARGLVSQGPEGLALTGAGAPHALRLGRERPDMYYYYYREFYPRAWASEAHSELCRRAFGRDLCQEGMTDMASLDGLLDRLGLAPGQRVLDLGCGSGGIADYVSRSRGVRVTGIDNSRPAIAQARDAFGGASDRLAFAEADLNHLDLEGPFDAAIAIDVLYWVADLKATLATIAGLLRPGGRIGVILLQTHPDGHGPGPIPPDKTKFGAAAASLGLAFDAVDMTAHNHAFWQRNHRAARDLKPRFEAEGNGFIADSLIREAEEEFLPGYEAGKITRYAYCVRVP